MKNGKKERILRILLNTIDKPLTKYQIAKLAKCTESWVGEFIKSLEEKKLVENTKVVKKKALYEYWLNNRTKNDYRMYLIENPIQFLKNINLPFAVTTYLAENLTQHHLFPSRVDIYVKEEEKEKWLKILNKKALLGGGNFKILFAEDNVFDYKREVFFKDLDKKILLVSKPQLILDLLSEGGSCVEAANFLIGD